MLFWIFVATIAVGIVVFLSIFLCRANKRGGFTCACCAKAKAPECERLISGNNTDKQE